MLIEFDVRWSLSGEGKRLPLPQDPPNRPLDILFQNFNHKRTLHPIRQRGNSSAPGIKLMQLWGEVLVSSTVLGLILRDKDRS